MPVLLSADRQVYVLFCFQLYYHNYQVHRRWSWTLQFESCRRRKGYTPQGVPDGVVLACVPFVTIRLVEKTQSDESYPWSRGPQLYRQWYDSLPRATALCVAKSGLCPPTQRNNPPLRGATSSPENTSLAWFPRRGNSEFGGVSEWVRLALCSYLYDVLCEWICVRIAKRDTSCVGSP